ncbi:MAG: nuclear transport factor 2 family protein [Mycobacterium sp.]|nr:nuclear transport factor 2 family protein [Mycobacterium sp.]
MLSLAEISDRLEIQQLLVDYATAIDQRRFDNLDRVFTPDAYIDYRAMGGIDGIFPQVKAWLAEVLPHFPAYAHLIGNIDLRLAGDTASGRTMCFNPLKIGPTKIVEDGPAETQVLFCALWYDDEFLRTDDGWRISRRVEAKCMDKLL